MYFDTRSYVILTRILQRYIHTYIYEKKNTILLYSPQFVEGTLRSSTFKLRVFPKKSVNTRRNSGIQVNVRGER